MSTLITIVLIFLALFIHLFLYWRRLKEDHASPQIFSSAFIIIFATAFGALLTLIFLIPRLQPSPIFAPSGLWFWGGMFGFIASLLFTVFHFRFKFFETLEANVVGIFLLLLSLFLSNAYFSHSWLDLGGSILIFSLIIFYYFLARRYKKFSWYRSGKVGFSGLVVLAIFFLLRASVAVHFGTMLSLSGRVEIVASSVVAFLLFFAIYNLAQL